MTAKYEPKYFGKLEQQTLSFDQIDQANFSMKRPGNLSLLRRELSDVEGHAKPA